LAKLKTVYFCTECGNETPRWQGQCPACGEWNTLAEEPRARASKATSPGGVRGAVGSAGAAQPARLAEVETAATERWRTGLDEFDFVLGGGIVPGSMVLVGGEPGIGKSTLLLQIAARLEALGRATLYVSGEESAAQVRMRAERMHEPAEQVLFLGETELDAILRRAVEAEPAALFVDSIQTVYSPQLEGAPGNVVQVRECAARLQRYAKQTGTAVFVVGHVTKGGMVAGPKTLEHIVDAVLYFEGSGTLDHRILRATKNRFGAADELGVFRMAESGLVAVANPSELFLRERAQGVSGSAVAATMEGTRPLLVEIQALCTRASYGAAQRVSTGFDRQRLALLLAVLEKRGGVPYGDLDVFLNVVGGVRIGETASDLAVAAALASAVFDRGAPADAVFVGEVGLGGELRPVAHTERRLGEAARMGFRTAYLAKRGVPRKLPDGIEATGLDNVGELLERLFR
jgi:DNA repair protein RadA/Sms